MESDHDDLPSIRGLNANVAGLLKSIKHNTNGSMLVTAGGIGLTIANERAYLR
jgi:hypothetical protein